MGISKRFAALAGAGLTALMTGCASVDSMYGQNTRAVNKPQNTGIEAYGSEACRTAEVEVVPASSFYQNRNHYRRNYSVFDRAFGNNQTIKNQYSVTSDAGQNFVLVSDRSEKSLFTLAGVGAGVAVTAPGGRSGHRNIKDAGKTLVGAALGGFIGGLADDAVNARAREAFDRCRIDVAKGAYDIPNQGGYRQDAPSSYNPYNRGGSYDPYEAARNRLNLR